MGLIILLLFVRKFYSKLINLHKTINGNWFIYLNNLFKYCLNDLSHKQGRFDLHDVDTEGDPCAVGILPHPEEWHYQCPQKNRCEDVFIYGTNTWGQYLIIEIKWRPQKVDKIDANVRLIFKDENGLVYEMNENDLLTIESNERLKSYKICGLNVEVLEPYRKLRVNFRGYLLNNESNELIYTRFTLFWCTLSNVFDLQSNFDRNFRAQQLAALGITKDNAGNDDRHEQWGQLIGSVQFGQQSAQQIYLWGNKAKQLLHNNKHQDISKVTRIYGFSCKSFAFHIGAYRQQNNYRVKYGYVSLGVGTVYPISSMNCSFNDLESIGVLVIKLKLEISDQNREFDIEISKSDDNYNNINVCEMTLNGQKGKCVVVSDEYDGKNITNYVHQDNSLSGPAISSDLVLDINDLKAKCVGLTGGKGSSLAALVQLSNNCETNTKFIVPKGVIVTTNAYNQLVNNLNLIQNDIDKLENVAWSEKREGLQKCCQEVSENFAKQELPENLRENIKQKLFEMFGNNWESIRFAIRSSAVTEDSEQMSTAGQMTTILGVKGLNDISRAVMKCWSSQFEFVAVEYKRGYGQPINCPMAVVIQEMVDCEAAGVIFTCDPLTGDERHVLITANYGIGESVVSAQAEPDTITLDVLIESNSLLNKRSITGIESIEIGSKLKSIVLNDNNESGTIEVMTVNSDKCCLNDNQCLSLGEVSLEVHRFYGNPRDIEWGLRDNQIYLLQSRPISSLNKWLDWEICHRMDSGQQSESEYFSRANLGEVFPGASSHLCLSWVTTVWNINGFRKWRNTLGLPKTEFSSYYNRGGGIVNNHYFFLLKTGTFPFVGDARNRISKSIQIGMFGHEFGEEYDDLINDSNDKAPKKSLSLYRKIYLFFGSFKYFLTPGHTLKLAQNDLKNFNIFSNKIDFTAKDVLAAILGTTHSCCDISYAHGKATICSMVYNAVLLDILKKANNDTNEANIYADFGQLVSSANQVVSAQVPNLMRDIALSIENGQQFCQMSDEKALKYLLNLDTKASVKFKKFLLDYGHRGYKEFDPMALQWADNPIAVVKSLKIMLSADKSLRPKKTQSLDETLSLLKTKLTFSKKLLLKYLVIPWCQSGISLRERSKHEMTKNFNDYRRAFWRLARLMVTEGRLPEPDLLFHMTLPEVHELFNERDPTIIANARHRRRLHSIQESVKYDETTIGPNITPRNDDLNSTTNLLTDGTARIKGTPVSSGKIKGRCCVAMSLNEAINIQSGDILVTYSTDIGWSPYFPMLSGLATEIGGLISHGAVIAREYGLPCLVGVDGANRLFRTGDQVVIDTQLGEIYKVID